MATNDDSSRDSTRDDERKEKEEKLKGFVTDAVKKLFTVGVGAAFMTEESIRKYLNDVKLPRDVLGTLLQSANRSKEELMNTVTDEVVNVIKKIDFVKEASRFVEDHKFKISAEIEVVKKEGVDPDSGESTGESSFETKVKMT